MAGGSTITGGGTELGFSSSALWWSVSFLSFLVTTVRSSFSIVSKLSASHGKVHVVVTATECTGSSVFHTLLKFPDFLVEVLAKLSHDVANRQHNWRLISSRVNC